MSHVWDTQYIDRGDRAYHRDPDNQLVEQLQDYELAHCDDMRIWREYIPDLDGYNADATKAIDLGADDRFVANGTVFHRWLPLRRWSVGGTYSAEHRCEVHTAEIDPTSGHVGVSTGAVTRIEDTASFGQADIALAELGYERVSQWQPSGGGATASVREPAR